jgi:hypothetical protein
MAKEGDGSVRHPLSRVEPTAICWASKDRRVQCLRVSGQKQETLKLIATFCERGCLEIELFDGIRSIFDRSQKHCTDQLLILRASQKVLSPILFSHLSSFLLRITVILLCNCFNLLFWDEHYFYVLWNQCLVQQIVPSIFWGPAQVIAVDITNALHWTGDFAIYFRSLLHLISSSVFVPQVTQGICRRIDHIWISRRGSVMPHFKEISNPNRVYRLKRAVVWWSQRINSSPLLNSEIWFQSCATTFKEFRSPVWIGVAVIVKIIVEITILKSPRFS